MLAMQFIADTQPDPIWLRTLSTVLPVLGTIVVAILTGQKVLEKRREKKADEAPPPSDPPSAPTQVAVVATEKASSDPILRLFIEDLHTRLSMAHEEAAKLHQLRAVDAGTIARLSAEIADKEDRLREVEELAGNSANENRELRRKVQRLTLELEETRRQLAICTEGYT